MLTQVDLYNNAYARVEHDLYRQVRTETYGQDLGQTSWVTSDESDRIPELLNLSRDSNVLEIGSGSGLYALHLARRIGCRITGLELNPSAIASSRSIASVDGHSPLADFQQCDASQPLHFAPGAFHAAFANDVVCHIPGRARLLEEMFRASALVRASFFRTPS
jgi:SAM-dependent methyltransferase